MKFIWKKYSVYFNFIYLLSIFLSLTNAESDITLHNGNIDCKVIVINKTIIYIDSDSDINDDKIYCYDIVKKENCSNLKYDSESIRSNKGILKLNDLEFLIYGINMNANGGIYLTFEKFLIKNNKVTSGNNKTNFFLNITGTTKIYPKVIDSGKIIISSIYTLFDKSKCKVFLIDINNNIAKEYSISESDKLKAKIDSLSNKDVFNDFKCESLDGNNFFCILTYKNVDLGGKIFYINANFDKTNEEIVETICSSYCTNGNLETINNNKYLVCYQKAIQIHVTYSLTCKYYLYNSNDNYFKPQFEEQISTFTGAITDEPLILYKFNYTIIIVFEYHNSVNGKSDYYFNFFVSSYDFQIKSAFDILKLESSQVDKFNFINDESYIYFIYKKTSNLILRYQKIIRCHNHQNITLSESKTIQRFKLFGEDEKLGIDFALNENINLNPIMSYNDPEVTSKINISFVKGQKSGVFENYYLLSNESQCSLICRINVTTCFSTCGDCIFGKEGTSDNNYCTSCIEGYVKKEDDESDYFNCYRKNESLKNYYIESGKFLKCDDSCKYCINGNSCEICNNEYYFIYENSKINNHTICFRNPKEYYYLNNNKSLSIYYNGIKENISSVFEKCFERCKTCLGEGNRTNHNCLKCEQPYKSYDTNIHQCLIDHNDECFIKNKTWVLKDDYSDITCLDKCNDSIVLFGVNIGQCVKNCSNYKSLYFTDEILFTLIDCNNQNYCIPLDVCYKGKFKVFIHNRTCIRNPEVGCNVNVFDKIDPFAHDGDTVIVPTTHPITQAIKTTIIKTEKITQIPSTSIDYKDDKDDGLRKMKIIKIFSENENYTNYNIFDKDLIDDYIRMLKRESDNPNSININLIFIKVYANFIISIYPLEHEKYVYDNVIIPNNLGYINFTNIFKEINDNMNNRKLNDNSIKLVILLESISYNSPLNELNYYFCEFNEKTQERKFINLTESNFTTLLNVIYPLKNYYKENSTINKRNSEYLVDNIKEIYSKDPKIQIYNINDPLYNDICYHFDTGIDVEMTLDIKRKEFYVNKSLCEDNCYLEKLIINENVKSVCMCKLKSKFSFNKNAGVKDDIPLKSTNTAKSVYCFKETFNTNNIAKNPIFWAFLFIIIFVFALILIYIFIYRHKEFEGMFELNNKDSNVINNKINPDIDINEIKVKNSINSSENENNNKSNEDNSISDISQIDKKDSESNKKNNMVIKLNNRSIKNKSKKISLYDNSDNKDSLKNEEKNPIELVSSNNKI